MSNFDGVLMNDAINEINRMAGFLPNPATLPTFAPSELQLIHDISEVDGKAYLNGNTFFAAWCETRDELQFITVSSYINLSTPQGTFIACINDINAPEVGAISLKGQVFIPKTPSPTISLAPVKPKKVKRKELLRRLEVLERELENRKLAEMGEDL